MHRPMLAVSAVVLSLVLFASETWAELGCLPVSGSQQLAQSAPMGIFEGQAWLTIGDNSFHADVTSVVTGVKVIGETVHTTTRVIYDFGNGDTFTLGNSAVITPTLGEPAPGVLGLNVQGRIVEGTGRFEDAFGRFVSQGTISFVTGLGQTDQRIEGVICDMAE